MPLAIPSAHIRFAGVTHGYLFRRGNFTSIDFPGSDFTEIWGIHPQGDMIGRYRIAADGTNRTRGFFLSHDGTFTDISVGTHLHTLPTGISASRRHCRLLPRYEFPRGYARLSA